MESSEIKKKIRDKWIRINMIFEMVGNPKEHIEKALKDYMANIKTDSGVEMLSEDYGETEEIENGLYTTFVEAEMLVNSLEKLTWLSFNFSPASIEILEPAELAFKAGELQNWINDLLSKLHEVAAVSKQISSHNKLLVNNMNRLIKNSILFCISMGKDTPKDMEKNIGIPFKQLKPFLEALMREGRLDLHENQYRPIKVNKPEAEPKKAKPAKKKK